MSLPLEALEDKDILTVEDAEGNTVTYEVVCIAEDEDSHQVAICYSEAKDDFIVTDLEGNQIDKTEAQAILDAFDTYKENEV